MIHLNKNNMKKKILLSLMFPMGIMTGKTFDLVVLKHNLQWWLIGLFVIGLIYTIWYFRQILVDYNNQ
jgi:Ni,Fe-hydrogenase I cytochrome b subunit